MKTEICKCGHEKDCYVKRFREGAPYQSHTGQNPLVYEPSKTNQSPQGNSTCKVLNRENEEDRKTSDGASPSADTQTSDKNLFEQRVETPSEDDDIGIIIRKKGADLYGKR